MPPNHIRNSVTSVDVSEVERVLSGSSAQSLNLDKIYTDSTGQRQTILDLAREMEEDMGRIIGLLIRARAPTAEQVLQRSQGKSPRHPQSRRSKSRGRSGTQKNK